MSGVVRRAHARIVAISQAKEWMPGRKEAGMMRSVTRGVGWLLIFLVVQVSIAVVLKIAAVSPGLRLGGTVLGAALTATGLFLLALGTPK